MNSIKDFLPVLPHWSFGLTILVGLVASTYTGAESILAIFLAGLASTISSVCSCTSAAEAETIKRQQRCSNLLNFLIIWLDVLTNLVASATCARLASATIDYISKGHFREFLFGMEQHSLGEPWPDVLGVAIILVVTILFMMGLEKSSTISILLAIALLSSFTFFSFVGSFHTVANNVKLKIHSTKTVLNAAAICSYAFAQQTTMSTKNNCLKIMTASFVSWLFYTVLGTIFSLMTHYRELDGTAIPLIQVFQTRDVDWARPVMAALTICVVCCLLTEVLPNVYFTFVQLASKEWSVFVSSIQYRSSGTGAPVLAIFAAGSLAAILAFACPLSHLIKLLNVSSLIKCTLMSCQLVSTRYRPDILFNNYLPGSNTTVHYSKLTRNSSTVNFKEKLKQLFVKTPKYFHKLTSPSKLQNSNEEQECLLFERPPSQPVEAGITSDNEENEMDVMSMSSSATSTDIDVVVEEYKEGMRVATLGGHERTPATKFTSILVINCLILIVVASIGYALHLFRFVSFYWPNLFVFVGGALIIAGLPANAAEKSKPCLLPSCLFPFVHCMSIVINTIMAAMIIATVWQGVIFWTIAGLVLYWRCDCCQCENLLDQTDPDLSVFEINDHLIIAR